MRAYMSPDFGCVPFPHCDQEEEGVVRPDFLRFQDGMGPERVCMSVLWTGDPTEGDLNLRPTGGHTNFFSTRGRNEAGHHHCDVTPETIHYVGFLHPAGRILRGATSTRFSARSQADGGNTHLRRQRGFVQPARLIPLSGSP